MQPKPNPRREIAAMVFAVVFPSVITWVYFVSLRGAPAAAQQAAYGIGKLIQFGFPVAWVALIARAQIFQLRVHGASRDVVTFARYQPDPELNWTDTPKQGTCR